MDKYGLIGYPLGHSFSKTYFSDKFKRLGQTDSCYELFPLESLNELETLVKNEPKLRGLNVTIPYKIGVLYYLDKISEEARAVDAVNCIKIVKKDSLNDLFSGEVKLCSFALEGYNTDVYGFENSLQPLLKKQHTNALVLGSGGASRAVTYVLKKLNISYKVVSRKATPSQLSYEDITPSLIERHKLLINTTPLGMAPHIDDLPKLPYDSVGRGHLLYDLIYNPETTLFLKEGKKKGAMVKNGLEMLILQAEKSWEIWRS